MTIKINMPMDIEATLIKASRTAKSNGGFFSGNEKSGRFGGRGVEGGYTVDSHDITVVIDKKPILFPAKAVESYVRDFFKSA